jgi:hypothetical protein
LARRGRDHIRPFSFVHGALTGPGPASKPWPAWARAEAPMRFTAKRWNPSLEIVLTAGRAWREASRRRRVGVVDGQPPQMAEGGFELAGKVVASRRRAAFWLASIPAWPWCWVWFAPRENLWPVTDQIR